MKRHALIPLFAFLAILVPCLGRAESPAPSDAAPNARYVRIGHYQCVCRQGDFEANLNTVVKGLELASEAGLDVVSFPESFLTGYFPKEEVARANAFAIDSPEMGRVLERTSRFEPMFMVGFNELRGDDLYNTVAVIEKGKVLGRYSKAMPIHRYFVPGREFPVFEKKGLKFGVVICADGGYIEPTRILALKGARLIFAPHFNFVGDPVRHYQMVRNDHIARAVENGVYFLRANNVVPGRELEGSDYAGYGYGDSYLVDPTGEIVSAAGLFHEYLMIYNFDLQMQHRSRHNWRSVKSATELLDILKEALDSQAASSRPQ
ncbi:MAG TPA: carbon-nitrogen hydrolase family protein [Thermoguttaceae bacterium]|nr:carbon-nitrogen hydrolase family protein [Thermoguttaceae bacterium]